MECRLIGCWRIVSADLWERGYLDLCGPAMLDIRANGHGHIAFGALQASLDLAYDGYATWLRVSIGLESENNQFLDAIAGRAASRTACTFRFLPPPNKYKVNRIGCAAKWRSWIMS